MMCMDMLRSLVVTPDAGSTGRNVRACLSGILALKPLQGNNNTVDFFKKYALSLLYFAPCLFASHTN